jgi:hypothetical protein
MKRITNDAREDEMEENLNMVGDIVGDLRQQVWWIMALWQGTAIASASG